MMPTSLPLLLLILSSVLSAPAPSYDDYTVAAPEKRAALMLDRLFVALQKALREVEEPRERGARGVAPHMAPLRIAGFNDNNMDGVASGYDPQMSVSAQAALDPGLTEYEGPRAAPLRIAATADNTSTLQRRGQGGGGRGRVLRCYFNAITCF